MKATLVSVALLFALAASSAALAKEAVPQPLLNLDLCSLAYKLYHQSLILPLDPWYDLVSRPGSDRRTNICRLTHGYASTLASSGALYAGPNAIRGWTPNNDNLDPILTGYRSLDLRLPTFNRDGERFIALATPDYLQSAFKSISVIRYSAKPKTYPCFDVEKIDLATNSGAAAGAGELIVFEGGTGVADGSEPAWSPMGYVAMLQGEDGKYDAHIVFRGSRSGSSLAKTVWRAQAFVGAHKGNPDWITDLRSSKQVKNQLLSGVGTVTQGFSEVLPTQLGTITACLQYLEKHYPPPGKIYVTGHSLGAGLASQFASAVNTANQGDFGKILRENVRSWDWDKLQLYAYAMPIAGDDQWAKAMEKAAATHFWVTGDSVVEISDSRIAGLFIDKGAHCGVQKRLAAPADCKENVHEVFVIRDALKEYLRKQGENAPECLSWGYYDRLDQMLSAGLITPASLKDILRGGRFTDEFSAWLERVYAPMLADKSSYIGFKLQSTLDQRMNFVCEIARKMRAPDKGDAAELAELVKDVKTIDGAIGLQEEERWIILGLIMSRVEKSTMSMQEVLSEPYLSTMLR